MFHLLLNRKSKSIFNKIHECEIPVFFDGFYADECYPAL